MWKIGTARLDDLALAAGRAVQLAGRRVHERARVAHRVHVVVGAQRAVGAEADRHRLVPAVHRDEVDVHVDEQVGLRGPLVQLDRSRPARSRRARRCRPGPRRRGCRGGRGRTRRTRAGPTARLQLGRGHAAVHGQRRDQVDVVHARAVGALEHLLDHLLAHVRRAHRRQRQRDVVERDRQAHARAQQRVERVHPERVVERGGDRRLRTSARPGQRRRRVDDARADREPLQPQRLARVEQRSAATSRPPPTTHASRCAAARGTALERSIWVGAGTLRREIVLMRRSAGRRRSSRGRRGPRGATPRARGDSRAGASRASTRRPGRSRPASSSASSKSLS